MKSVLISINPKWCELIASGEKTVEVRKTKPKLETPFKVYIYETQGRTETPFVDEEGHHIFKGRGQVIGEFICDNIIDYTLDPYGYHSYFISDDDFENTCFTFFEELWDYGKGKTLYGWHISDLVIYDKPRELSGFFHYCGDNPKCEGCEAHYYSNTECGKEDYCCSIIEGCKPLKRPPQSWCYVERSENGK
jgi:hypothetical protein